MSTKPIDHPSQYGGPLIEVCEDSRGNWLWVQDNGVGGKRYWSDEIGGGVVVWDTALASAEMLGLALKAEGEADKTMVPRVWFYAAWVWFSIACVMMLSNLISLWRFVS